MKKIKPGTLIRKNIRNSDVHWLGIVVREANESSLGWLRLEKHYGDLYFVYPFDLNAQKGLAFSPLYLMGSKEMKIISE